jgi:hypothetical protein
MSGRDSAAAFKGLVIGLVALGVIVMTMLTLTNRSFDQHETAAESTH